MADATKTTARPIDHITYMYTQGPAHLFHFIQPVKVSHLLLQFQLFICFKPACLQKIFMGKYYPSAMGILCGRALWAVALCG